MKRLFSLLALSAAAASAGTLYLPAYPATVLVFDESKGKVVDRIPLETGTPMSIRLTPDHKKIYVTTIDQNGIEVIDVATRKVINHFVLNTATTQYRFRGGAVDPDGKLFYTVTREIDKLPEHFDVKHAKYTVIDLEQQKIVKTVDMPVEDERTNRLSYEVSPDGKYLYQFGPKIKILQTADFKVVDELDLAQPEFGAMENVHLGSDLDLITQPGVHTSVFNSADPIVHNKCVRPGAFGSGDAARGIRSDWPRAGWNGWSAGHAGQESPPIPSSPMAPTEISAASSGSSI